MGQGNYAIHEQGFKLCCGPDHVLYTTFQTLLGPTDRGAEAPNSTYINLTTVCRACNPLTGSSAIIQDDERLIDPAVLQSCQKPGVGPPVLYAVLTATHQDQASLA